MIDNLTCAKLCQACYWDTAQFDHIIQAGGDAVWAGVKLYPDCVAVAFRGSTTIEDWLHDFQTFMVNDPDLGLVEQGFLVGVRDAHDQISPLVDRPLVVTGHSLGAAHAFLFAALQGLHKTPAAKVVTFGPPRPGGSTVRALLQDTPGFSYKNGYDPVTDAPLDIPLVAPYIEPYPFIKLHAPPAENDPWGRYMGWHHIQNYVAALSETG